MAIYRVFTERRNGVTVAAGFYGGIGPSSAEKKVSRVAVDMPRIITGACIYESK
jgi:hypothetical protein